MEITNTQEMYSRFTLALNHIPSNQDYEYIGVKLFRANTTTTATTTTTTELQDLTVDLDGVIYNHPWLCRAMHLDPTQTTVQKCILSLYLKFGIEYTLAMLDGVFALVLVDQRPALEEARIYAATDSVGIRPLFWIHTSQTSPESFSLSTERWVESEYEYEPCTKLGPGSYLECTLSRKVHSKWIVSSGAPKMYTMFWQQRPFSWSNRMHTQLSLMEVMTNIVEKRLLYWVSVSRKKPKIGLLVDDQSSTSYDLSLFENLEHPVPRFHYDHYSSIHKLLENAQLQNIQVLFFLGWNAKPILDNDSDSDDDDSSKLSANPAKTTDEDLRLDFAYKREIQSFGTDIQDIQDPLKSVGIHGEFPYMDVELLQLEMQLGRRFPG